ncbi:MAG: hypothetical protein ACRDSZ_21740 [Pseudonocardiaceae bacterium]
MKTGTGSGYNAALLCERLSSKGITRVDIGLELVELAQERATAHRSARPCSCAGRALLVLFTCRDHADSRRWKNSR